MPTLGGSASGSLEPREGRSAVPAPLTLLLLRELPEAVPFILQCCSASLAMSEMNFCAASEISRMLRAEQGPSEPARGAADPGAAAGPGSAPPATHMRGSEASNPARFR